MLNKRIQDFFTTFPAHQYEKGDTIIHPNQPINYVYYLSEGVIIEYDIAPNGNEVVVNTFKAGSFFPMSSAINKTPNSYYFEAFEPVTVYKAPAKQAVTFITENPDIMYDLLSRVYKGADGILRRMAHLMGGSAYSRLLFEIINSARRFGQVKKDGTIPLSLRENDLAKLTGLSRETVNRNLGSLKKDGIIKISSNGIVVCDLERLEDLLGMSL
jgi:CRP/FNR family cyclic AMP-dependent transcriptional regulator